MHEKRDIYLVEGPNQEELASTFLRFQEHYESPEFRGKIFDFETYERWYTSQYGEFSYYTDWSGFNLPSYVFEPFLHGAFNPLSGREENLLAIVRTAQSPFHMIGVVKPWDMSTVRHEIVHGFFYTVDVYREHVLAVLAELDTAQMCRLIKEAGYHDAVLLDEVNAYSTTGIDDFLWEGGLTKQEAKRIGTACRKVFYDHFGFWPQNIRKKDVPEICHMRSL